jgi:hypothetical protein
MSSSEAARSLSESMSRAEGPSQTEKVDFVRAVFRGIEPDTEAARTVARKKQGETGAAPQVEILRRIPAQSAVESGHAVDDASARALALAAEVEKAVEDGDLDRFQPQALQALMSALCRLYAAGDEQGRQFDVLGERTSVTATDAMVLCGALLEAVDLQVFELALWQSWSSR